MIKYFMLLLFSIMFILVTFFFVILIFSSKRLSPIPYFPTNKQDLPLIIKTLKLKKNQVIYDLGAGDGIIIFEAAKKAKEKKLNTKFIAVEINPILILFLHLRRFFHSNRENIKIIRDDIFEMEFKHLTSNIQHLTFYLYISPWYLEKTLANIRKQIPNYSLVSYMYPIKSLKQGEIKFQGKNTIFVYSYSHLSNQISPLR